MKGSKKRHFLCFVKFFLDVEQQYGVRKTNKFLMDELKRKVRLEGFKLEKEVLARYKKYDQNLCETSLVKLLIMLFAKSGVRFFEKRDELSYRICEECHHFDEDYFKHYYIDEEYFLENKKYLQKYKNCETFEDALEDEPFGRLIKKAVQKLYLFIQNRPVKSKLFKNFEYLIPLVNFEFKSFSLFTDINIVYTNVDYRDVVNNYSLEVINSFLDYEALWGVDSIPKEIVMNVEETEVLDDDYDEYVKLVSIKKYEIEQAFEVTPAEKEEQGDTYEDVVNDLKYFREEVLFADNPCMNKLRIFIIMLFMLSMIGLGVVFSK